jgi:hypothetical protein
MESLENFNKKPEKGSKAAFWAVAVIGILIVAGIIAFLFTRPTTREYQQQMIEGALREGPEFDAINKRIAVENDEGKTSQSPTAMGTIQMSIWGRIRNLSTDKTITGLEVKVMVVDLSEKPVKEKTVIVIPQQQATLGPAEVMPVHIIMDGFQPTDNRANIHWKVTAIKLQ